MTAERGGDPPEADTPGHPAPADPAAGRPGGGRRAGAGHLGPALGSGFGGGMAPLRPGLRGHVGPQSGPCGAGVEPVTKEKSGKGVGTDVSTPFAAALGGGQGKRTEKGGEEKGRVAERLWREELGGPWRGRGEASMGEFGGRAQRLSAREKAKQGNGGQRRAKEGKAKEGKVDGHWRAPFWRKDRAPPRRGGGALSVGGAGPTFCGG